MVKNLLLTGASGWFGKSFIYEGYKIYGKQFIEANFFAASEAKSLSVIGIPEKINFVSLKDALKFKNIDYLVQNAFITRDKITKIGIKNYKNQVSNIIEISNRISLNNKLMKHILISSGDVLDQMSLYGTLKRIEENYVIKSTSIDKKIFRIYSGSGYFLPKLDWSGLSNFVQSFYNKSDINIKSDGQVLRSFVDFSDLSNILLKYISKKKIYQKTIIDACNIDTDLIDIAYKIAMKGNIKVILPSTFSNQKIASDYRGKKKDFLHLAKFVNHQLFDIDEQIENSMNSFQFK